MLGSPQDAASFRAQPPAAMWVLHGLQCGDLLQCGVPGPAGSQATSAWSSPGKAQEYFLWLLGHGVPLLLL